jgi:hypothetical protein
LGGSEEVAVQFFVRGGDLIMVITFVQEASVTGAQKKS